MTGLGAISCLSVAPAPTRELGVDFVSCFCFSRCRELRIVGQRTIWAQFFTEFFTNDTKNTAALSN
jgi:hypothetical protein